MLKNFKAIFIKNSNRKTLIINRFSNQVFNNNIRCYHSYPDPDEKPRVTTHQANQQKTLNKELKEYKLDDKFKLDTLFPGTPISKGIIKGEQPKTESTVLSNGLTVASQEMPGMMVSFAFIIKTGSSYENQNGLRGDTGATHVLELNGFRSTYKRPQRQLITEVENLGGMVQCVSTRESIIYCIDVIRQHAEQALDILSDTIMNPMLTDEEIDETKQIIEIQQDELPSEIFSREAVQMAAYSGYPLSNSHMCPLEGVGNIDKQMVLDFRNRFLFGDNCILSAAGIDHQSFVELVNKKFSNLPKSNSIPVRKPSVFTGGMIVKQKTLKEPFVKVAMAFEIGGWKHDKIVAACVMQMLLGGGSSFSAGGPGKGMYTRLYTQVLNQFYWAESVEAFLSIHEDSGIFGIDGSCPPENIVDIIKVIVDQLFKLGFQGVTDEEINRAKNMLKSMMMMQLESRIVLCEDIARQYSTYGKREMPHIVCDKIDKVTKQDIKEIAFQMIQKPPSVGIVGHDIVNVPSYSEINQFTKQYRENLMKMHKK